MFDLVLATNSVDVYRDRVSGQAFAEVYDEDGQVDCREFESFREAVAWGFGVWNEVQMVSGR